ncbi:IucA/IucC family protein [Paenibacillus sp. PL91]|uniref:IucA/IucC family protein n=1 Tax=Paenibacillus sp. PL91 TaxID=2729538 RepID=UPI0039834993
MEALNRSQAKRSAEEATITNLLNCYLREAGSEHEITVNSSIDIPRKGSANEQAHYLHLPLVNQHVDVYMAVQYVSATGRHLYHFPIYYRNSALGAMLEADFLTLTALIVKELSIVNDNGQFAGEFVYRVIQSCHNIQAFIEARMMDQASLYGTAFSFMDAEQALLFGHSMHPTPKSRQGIPDTKQSQYSPELKGHFRMHYFAAKRTIVREGSSMEQSASDWIKGHIRKQISLKSHPIQNYIKAEDWSIIPVHPLQADWLAGRPEVIRWLELGELRDLGPLGEEYKATSSIRTVYNEEAPFMLKVSVPIKVTNSLRMNKSRELESGGEVKRLLDTAVGDVSKLYPAFTIVNDPAYITLQSQEQAESGFEVVLRMNPFMKEEASQATVIAALVQQPIPGSKSRLGNIVHSIAQREGKTTAEISVEWFRRYLNMSLSPMLWLYMKYGIALEAHQQNSVVRLHEGYPVHYYYRDNQGYYFCESTRELLEQALPGIGKRTGNFYADAIVDERICYYLIVNHLFGLIQGFGAEGLIEEKALLQELIEVLEAHIPMGRSCSSLFEMLLGKEKLPCKANLLTRFYDVDELAGSNETPAIYVQIDNPIFRVVQEAKLSAARKMAAIH